MADYLSPTTDEELVAVAADLDAEYDRALTKVLDDEPTSPLERARFARSRDELVAARQFWRQVGAACGTRPPEGLGIVAEHGDGTTSKSWEA